jgi:hypothetical protein
MTNETACQSPEGGGVSFGGRKASYRGEQQIPRSLCSLVMTNETVASRQKPVVSGQKDAIVRKSFIRQQKG